MASNIKRDTFMPSETINLAKKIRRVQTLGAVLGLVVAIALSLLGLNIYIAIAIGFIPIIAYVAFLGHQLGKKFGIPEIQSGPALPKKEVSILLLLCIIGALIWVFISWLLSVLFFVIVFYTYGEKLRQQWKSKLKESVKVGKKKEFEKAMREVK